LGYKVIGDNHLGDWGTQFGTLLYQISNSQLAISNLNIDKLEELYVEFHKKAEEKSELWDEARSWFRKLEEGDKEARSIWKAIKEISLEEFERIYKILGVKIDEAYGESFYEDKMQDVISEVRVKGLSKRSEGAEIVELHGMPPAILVKSDGTTTYYTRDLATIKFRKENWSPDLIIYEVGSEQKLHFQQVFETARILYWLNGTELVHVAHGLIRFASGKISTRKGQTIKLEQVLREAVHRAQKIIEKSKTSLPLSGQANRSLSAKEKEEVSKAVGIGAVIYFDLMHHPESDIIFDWEKMFVLEGNSAPYLQYTYARTRSVLRNSKLKTQNLKLSSVESSVLSFKLNAEELALMRSFIHFPEIIEAAATNYSPNLLCNYLFDLAQKFNNFYNQHRILDKASGDKSKTQHTINYSPNTQVFRLALTTATGQILKNGLNILGIDTPSKM
jgi:arginyl-tRNA synthetase